MTNHDPMPVASYTPHTVNPEWIGSLVSASGRWVYTMDRATLGYSVVQIDCFDTNSGVLLATRRENWGAPEVWANAEFFRRQAEHMRIKLPEDENDGL